MALDGVSSQHHTPAALLTRKGHLVPNEWETGWAPELVWMFWKRQSLVPTKNQTTAQPAYILKYTDSTIPAIFHAKRM
jgi:hypothetical protein